MYIQIVCINMQKNVPRNIGPETSHLQSAHHFELFKDKIYISTKPDTCLNEFWCIWLYRWSLISEISLLFHHPKIQTSIYFHIFINTAPNIFNLSNYAVLLLLQQHRVSSNLITKDRVMTKTNYP